MEEVNKDRKGTMPSPAEGQKPDLDLNQQDRHRLRVLERNLSTHESWLQLIVEQIPALLWTTDNNLVFTTSKGEGLSALGLKNDDMLGRTLFDYFQTNEPDFLPIRMHRRALAGESVRYDFQWQGYTFDSCLEPLVDATGNISGVIGIALDATECKQDEQSRRDAEEKYRHLYKNTPAMLHSIDRQGYLTSVSNLWLETLGYQRHEVIGRKYSEFLTESSRRHAEEVALPRFFRTGSARDVPYQFVKKDGEIMEAILSATAERDESGRIIRSLAVITDISELKKSEAALRQSEAHLHGLATRLTQVEETERKKLALELHDQIGRDLTALNIDLSIIRKQLSPESAGKVETRLCKTMATVEQIAQQVRSVMTRLRPEVLDDYGLMAALQWHCEQLAERNDIEIVAVGKGLSPRLPQDTETTLFRIAQEAIANAMEHARARRITVSLEDAGKIVRLVIHDDGMGFNPPQATRPEAGKAWGVPTMMERARSVGGKFEIQTRPGTGTKVIVELNR